MRVLVIVVESFDFVLVFCSFSSFATRMKTSQCDICKCFGDMFLKYVVEGPLGFKNCLHVGLLASTHYDHGVRLCPAAFVDKVFQDFHSVEFHSLLCFT